MKIHNFFLVLITLCFTNHSFSFEFQELMQSTEENFANSPDFIAHCDTIWKDNLPATSSNIPLVSLGSSYGGWQIPDNIIASNSICYCFGAGEDISFDMSLIATYGCKVYCFDPTPRSAKHIKYIHDSLKHGKPAYINSTKAQYQITGDNINKLLFYPFGLWWQDAIIKFYAPANPKHVSHSALNLQHTGKFFEAPCKKLSTIMQELKHDHIDLLKMDIEGAEYPVLDNMLQENILPHTLCVEFHKSDQYNTEEVIARLIAVGYTLVAKNKNTDFTFILDAKNSSRKPSMAIHEYHVELFKNDPVSTEYNAYKLLKDKPLVANVNYVAIPWAVLINSKKLDLVPKIKLNGGFTICQHIRYEQIIPLLVEMGVEVLFTPHASKTKVYDKIKVVPFPHFAVNGIDTPEHKDVIYSFVGVKFTHPTRAQILQMKPLKTAILIERKKWHFWQAAAQQEREKNEYQQVLARSRFSLCPRGTGPSTLRFWESLQAGAIPVLIADDTVLPDGIDWNQCIIQVAEKDVQRINTIISNVSITQEKEMRKNCITAYHLFSGQNFVSNIRLYYSKENQ